MENLKQTLTKAFKEGATIEEHPNALFLIRHTYGVCRFTKESIWINAIHYGDGDFPSKTYAPWNEETLQEVLVELRHRVATITKAHEAKEVVLQEAVKAAAQLKADFPLAEIRDIDSSYVNVTFTTEEARIALEAIRKYKRTV